MSKAFTTDSDEEENFLEAPALAPGARNYITKTGAERLQAEADQLAAEHRRLTADVKDKSRAKVIERRLRYLEPRLEAMQVIDPLNQPKDRVLFGATVTVKEDQTKPATWRIVGLDEADLDRGAISWMSPLATALLDKRMGEIVSFMGRSLTIMAIAYEA